MTTPTQELIERLRKVSEWKQIIERHRRHTDDPSITYVLKDGTRVHEDESVIAKLAASLSRALEDAADVSNNAASRITELQDEVVRMRALLAAVDERALDVSFRAGVAHVWAGPDDDRPRDVHRTVITAYLAALTLPRAALDQQGEQG